MAKSVRMADIAEKLGVSVVTVSKAINGKEGVGSALRIEILKTAEEMGYSINSSRSGNTSSIVVGIINSYLYLEKGSSFYWSLYEKLLRQLTDSDNLCILEVVSQDAQDNLVIPKLIQSKRIDALIIMGPFPEEYMNMLFSINLPMVILDAYNAKFPLDSVISDGYYGMYLMTNYLLERGHRKIGFVGTVGETSSITDRYYGYCKAMTEFGLEVTKDMVIPDRSEIGKIELNLPSDLKSRFTALVCNCDFTAYEVVKLLPEMGINVPDDLSIVGFDNYILSEVSPVQLTTYAVNQQKMAVESIAQLFERIQNPVKKRDMRMISGNIIERDSVKSLN